MVAAISYLTGNGRLATHEPVTAITLRIERARARVRQQRAAPPAYGLFEDGRLIGAIYAPDGSPRFGPAAPTVLLTKNGERR